MSKLAQIFFDLPGLRLLRLGNLSRVVCHTRRLLAAAMVTGLFVSTPASALSTMTFTSTGNNFTLLDSTGALFGGTNNVTFKWDGTYASSTAQAKAGVRNAELSSPTNFVAARWFAHHVTLYAPGTYTIYTGCPASTTDLLDPTYDPGCGLGRAYTLVVGPGQVGGHMLFNWNNNNNIDVIQLWTRDAAFGPSPMCMSAATGCSMPTGGSNPADKIWGLMSIDTPPSTFTPFDITPGVPAEETNTYNGTQMIDGPFPGFSANFNLTVTLPAAASLGTTTPSNGQAEVPLDTTIELTFTRPMNAATVAGAFTLKGPGGVTIPGTMNPSTGLTDTTFTFTPSSPLNYETVYTAEIDATARDASGLTLVAGAANPWTFTTQPAPINPLNLLCNAATPGTFTGVFTMLDPAGGRVGRDVGVTGTWDGTVNTASNGTNFNMTLVSPNPFFGAVWTTHDIRVFGPGTYTINTGCTVAELRAGTPPASCAVQGEPMTFTVGPGQLGAHMLFDWSGNNNISVVNVWNRNTRSSCIPSAVPLRASDGTPIGYGLAVTEVNGDGVAGLPMATSSPFPRFNANFDLYPGSAGSATLATLPEAGPAGGGCVISGDRSIDPTLPGLLLAAVGWVGLRSRSQKRSR